MTQKEQVLEYMRKHGGISSIQAFHIGITRLSARIWELRHDGVKIKSDRVIYRTEGGKTKQYDLYSLEQS